MVEAEAVEGEQSSENAAKNALVEGNGEAVACAKTNRNLPIFWCATCCTKLTSPTQAITHLNGKSHKSKVTQESRKRGLPVPEENKCSTENEEDGPTSKKSKAESAEVEHCKDCDILLNSAVMADQHYKGKKHASTVAKKEKAKNLPPDTIPVPDEISKSHFCECCQVPLNSDEQAQQHVNGQRHKVKAGIIVKKPPPPPPSSKIIYPPQAPRGGLNGRNGGRGGQGRGRGRGNFTHRGTGRGWVKGGVDFVGGHQYSSPSHVNNSSGDRGRGRGWSSSRGSSDAYRGRTEASRGRGYHSRASGDRENGRAHDESHKSFGVSGNDNGWGHPGNKGYQSSYTTQPSQAKSYNTIPSGSSASEYEYSTYNFNSTSQEKSTGSNYQSYDKYYSSGTQNNYPNATQASAEKPNSTPSNQNHHSNNGYSTAGYYEQNQNSQGTNVSQYANTSTGSTDNYYSSNYNKDAGYYSYGYYEQKPPEVQAADATYDSYYG